MLKFLNFLLLTFLLISQFGCKKIIKKIGKEAAKEGASELAKKADQRSKSQPVTSKDQISSLKKQVTAANRELNNYRLQCSKYKKYFDSTYEAQKFLQANSEFNSQHSHFYNWLSRQNFKTQSGTSSFAIKYNKWLTKFNAYHKSYTSAVIKSRNHCLDSINSQRRPVVSR